MNVKVIMAHQFLAGLMEGAVEKGDHGLRLCADNAHEALLDLETALAEIAALPDHLAYSFGYHVRARGIALRALGKL